MIESFGPCKVDNAKWNYEPWYDNGSVVALLDREIEAFNDLTDANMGNTQVTFLNTCSAVKAVSKVTCKSILRLYSLKTKECYAFDVLALKPTVPKVEAMEECAIKLTWATPANKAYTGFSIACKAEGDDNWSVLKVDAHKIGSNYVGEMSNLQADKTYAFKVFAEYEYCRVGSEKSEYMMIPGISQPDISKPGLPTISSIHLRSIVLRWEEPRAKNDIQKYIVYYKSKGKYGWSYWNMLETPTSSTLLKVDYLSR